MARGSAGGLAASKLGGGVALGVGERRGVTEGVGVRPGVLVGVIVGEGVGVSLGPRTIFLHVFVGLDDKDTAGDQQDQITIVMPAAT